MAKGLLCIWTDIDPAYESDFNHWYDHEHMAERIGIPGFELARRFVVIAGAPRYLALYRTASLEVFRSPAYRKAFANQTAWSRQTFGRMHSTIRRVGTIVRSHGKGEGGFLALRIVHERHASGIAAALDAVAERDGVVSWSLVQSDPALSVPLTGAAGEPVSDHLVLVEGTSPEAVAGTAAHVMPAHATESAPAGLFSHLWSLASGRAE